MDTPWGRHNVGTCTKLSIGLLTCSLYTILYLPVLPRFLEYRYSNSSQFIQLKLKYILYDVLEIIWYRLLETLMKDQETFHESAVHHALMFVSSLEALATVPPLSWSCCVQMCQEQWHNNALLLRSKTYSANAYVLSVGIQNNDNQQKLRC